MGRSQDASRALSKLRKIRAEYGEGRSAAKIELLASLSKASLARASQVLELHESLLFLRAYPDDAALLERVERELARFERRADLRRHREELASSGIAGTPIDYPFFPATAAWLVERFGARVTIDWDWFEHEPLLIERMPLFALWGETPALDELDLTARQWFQRMKSPRESDAEFFVRRVQALPVDSFVRERFYEELDVPMRLAWGTGGPSRTHAKSPVAKIAYQTTPLHRPRPDLRREVHVPPLEVREVSLQEGKRLVALAREAMVTRARDLDAFMHGDPRDVRLVDCGENLQFACIGVKPERRLLLESVYGFLTLKNGVPIGYVLCSALMASSEIAYNVFDTYRGAQAAHVYSRALAMVRALFGADTFTIYPYQLGYENDEGLKSGAWWFYQKLGFRSRERGVLRSMDRELGRMRRDPAHRSSRATLKKVVPYNVYLDLDAPRDDVIGIFPLAKVGESITRLLARRFGSDRERATRELSTEAQALLGSPPWKELSPEERQACERWAPLVFCLEGVESWSAAERRALFEVMRAKGGRRESDFVARFDAHAKLRAAFRAWQKPVSQRPSK
ncbi:MAG TPA: hypothetical protein VK843_13665 [Planctomycetota bacterium]|nr:hypothetical protein [Planctomycetota bacterium]